MRFGSASALRVSKRLYDHRRMIDGPVPYMERTRAYYAAQGFDHAYAWAHFDDVPFAPLSKPLAQSKLALITTASPYDRTFSDVRKVASGSTSDPPERLYGNDLAWDKNATHLDDLNAFFPLRCLKALVEAGRIGAITARFHCAPTEYSQRRTRMVDAPEILRRCREDGADAAMLVPL